MGYKTYQYRLYPTDSQVKRLNNYLNVTRAVWNMALEERILEYELNGKSISNYSQQQWLKNYRKTFPKAAHVSSQSLKVVMGDLDKAFKAFFRRVKAGESPGFPKFKSWKYWNSFGFIAYNNGFKISGRRFYIFGVGRIAVRWDRPYEGTIKTARVKRVAGKWFVNLFCDIGDPEPLPKTGRMIGIDMGINAMVATSDGDIIDNPHWYREAQAELRRRQRKLSRAVKGSNNRKKKLLSVQRFQNHIANQRKDFINKLVHWLIHEYDVIAIEDLNIKSMSKNKHLSKSILDSGWGYFRERLEQKALECGRMVIAVNPAYTSKTCSCCNKAHEEMTLKDRWLNCECGLSLDRDHNAAINILNRARRALEP